MSIEKSYDHWSSQYDHNKNRTRDLDKKITRESLQNLKFESVLELGCGTGLNTKWLQTKATKILAVDFSEKMLEMAQAKIDPDNVEFQKADINLDWTWTSKSFDLVTCNLVLEHIEDLDSIFGKAFSKLNSGGHLFISELHPFKQYMGTKARFTSGEKLVELKTYIHHISEFLDSGSKSGFELVELKEHFDDELNSIPRLLSLLFLKQ